MNMEKLKNIRAKGSFTIVIPVRNPEDDKVNNYESIELILQQTVQSLNRQTYKDIFIIVVCHRIPFWSKDLGDNIVFLNVAHHPVFPKNKNPVRVDKGLKYIIGILYARANLNPHLIMLMDADDYLNVNLAELLSRKNPDKKDESDGYIIKKGVQVNLTINSQSIMDYEEAYIIRAFDSTCGSCRIFKTNSLMQKLRNISHDLETKFSDWSPKALNSSVNVPIEPVIWLNKVTKPTYFDENSIVNILGRHVNQEQFFNFYPLSIIGAAKGCGHGNHDGPRKGELHREKLLREISIDKFLRTFGIVERNRKKQVTNLPYLASLIQFISTLRTHN